MRLTTIIPALIGLMATSVSAACRCSGVTNPGLYCYYCSEVVSGKQYYHAYECARNGNCHDYGEDVHCIRVSTSPIYCDGRDTWGKRELAEGIVAEGIRELEAREAEAEEMIK